MLDTKSGIVTGIRPAQIDTSDCFDLRARRIVRHDVQVEVGRDIEAVVSS